MERELCCPVCKELFDEPVKLYCHHHVCKSHLPQLTQGGVIACPTCGERAPLPADGHRVDRTLQLVVEVFREARARASDGAAGGIKDAAAARAAGPPLCGWCEERVATRRCAQCDGVLCVDCEQNLHSKAMFKNHTVVDLEEQGAGEAVDEYAPRMLCDEHPGERLSFYCDQCQRPVCSHCLILGSHKGHHQQPVDQAFATGRESLTQWDARLRQHADASTALIERLRDVEREVLSGAELQRSTINSECDKLKEAIEVKRRSLLSKSAAEEKQKRATLEAQMERAGAASRETSSLAARSAFVLQLKSTHPFLALVLPLIQDMQRCARQPVDTNVSVSSSYQPLSIDAAARVAADLDLGQRARSVQVSNVQQVASYSVSVASGGCSGYSAGAGPATMAHLGQPPPQQPQPPPPPPQPQPQPPQQLQPQEQQQTVPHHGILGTAPTVVYYQSVHGA